MSQTSLLAKNLYEQREIEGGVMGDVTFIVESERIRAHRNVLAILSEKYKAQFYGSHPDRGDIQVDGVTAAAFKEFLKLFYFDEVNLSIEHIGDVLDLAKQSLVDDFVKKCIDFLKRKMTIDNLCSVYRLAMLYDIKELKDLCEEKISKNTKALFATEDFANCDQETLMHILKLNSLHCSEGEVFDACIAWARADCDRKQLDASKPANLRATLGDAITQVRFVSMSLKEFIARHESLDGFFSSNEYIEITYIIAEVDSFQPMKFNATRREPIYGFLECSRVGRQLQRPVQYDGWNDLQYRCNKNIRWHGFVVNSDLVTEVDVQVLEPGNQNEWKRRSVSIENNNNETIVTFAEPVDVIPNAWQYISFKPTSSKKYSSQQTYENGIVVSNDVSFTFERCLSKYSLVSCLLFTQN